MRACRWRRSPCVDHRGAGGAFAAVTDIAQFREFTSGDDGIAYERRLDAVIDRLERVRRATIAVVDGPAVGGGCAIALACDLRICSPAARFGVPVAKTLGNCLSAANLARLVDLVGPAHTRDLLFTSRLVEASEALALGLATRVVAGEQLEVEVERLSSELAPVPRRRLKPPRHYFNASAIIVGPSRPDDVIACYGSDDFREGVTAFLEGRLPRWRSS